jgi:peptidoglycan/LPS O-acetylase OafA/YrhL
MTPCPSEVSEACSVISQTWIRGGWIGVDLFFVLSGFLVSGLLFTEYRNKSTVSIKRFLIRRGLKIYPAFYALMLMTISLELIFAGTIDGRGAFGELTFTQNYVGRLWPHTWSLAVEEHFYLLLSIGVYLALARRANRCGLPFKKLPYIFGLIACGCLLLRLIIATTMPYDSYTHMFNTHIRIDSLLFGVLLSYLWHFQNLQSTLKSKLVRYMLFIFGIALIVPPFFFEVRTTWWIPAMGVVLLYLGAGAILLSALPSSTFVKYRICRVLAYIGFYSYSIYLWHFPVERWLVPMIRMIFENTFHMWSWPLYFIAYFFSAVFFGIGMARLIEVPFLRMRERLFPSRTHPLETKEALHAS